MSNIGSTEHLERLRDSLFDTVERNFPQRKVFGKPESIDRALESLTATFTNQVNARPSQDRILKATTDFLKENILQNSHQARPDCLGACWKIRSE